MGRTSNTPSARLAAKEGFPFLLRNPSSVTHPNEGAQAHRALFNTSCTNSFQSETFTDLDNDTSV